MLYLNKVIIAGILLADPKLTKGGACFVKVAENFSYKNSEGEVVDGMRAIPVRFFKERAKTIADHFKKGSAIYIEARVEEVKREDDDGNVIYETIIVGQRFQFPTPK